MSSKAGTFYGIGVGPGDPELITLKSLRVLKVVDAVYAAASTKNAYSLAVETVQVHIKDTSKIELLRFPMTRDKEETIAAWRANARTVAEVLKSGKNAAFLTLGDPMTYSTYNYVRRYLMEVMPDADVVTIPGITSYQAAAAAANVPLVEGEESMLLLSGADGGDRLREVANKPDTVVFLKAYKNVKDIKASLDETGHYNHRVGICNCGKPDQRIVTDLEEFVERAPDYWTLIIAKHENSDDKA